MTADPLRWAIAAAAIALWLLLVAGVAWRARRRSEPVVDGADTLVVFASQTGMAEQLAGLTVRLLEAGGWPTRAISIADLDDEAMQRARRVFFVVATTGEGDPPDSAGRLVRTLMTRADPPQIDWALLSLGDTDYRDYCGFGRAIEAWMRRSGPPLFDPVEVDDADPEAVRHWQHQINALTGSNATADWTPTAFDPWRLVAREHLNPGSPGGEAYLISLQPVAALPTWQAGDIAEIAASQDGGGRRASRDYSIASLPADGRLELIVRLMRHPDGRAGLVSGRLASLAEGETIDLRIRSNSAFHAPALNRPAVLIGAGTGLAGLAGHIAARTGSESETWLMFGERTRAHDAFLDERLAAWRSSGVLTRLDRCFSRDAGDGRYVQAVIDENAAEVAAWVERGATILVCGALEGMAPGVHGALTGALGAERTIDLAETGRYRRDVY